MRRPPRPTPADIALLDPDGSFRQRLLADRQALASLSDSGDLGELRRIVHGLAGAAGTFGYRELGEVAIELDERMRDEGAVSAAEVARLLAALDQAVGAAEKSA